MDKIFFCLLIMLSLSCKRKATYSDVPKITYKSMFPKIIKAGASDQKTTISMTIEDGNGDIGFGTNNLFLKDSRDSSTIAWPIPVIPSEYSPEKGIKGTITIDYLAAHLNLRPDTNHIHADTLHWDIYMKDQAGNISNTIVTDDLFLTN